MALEQFVNCFEWQSRSSDYLDGSLVADQKSEADQHLSGCADCRDRHQHYREILGSIASQPRVLLPAQIRKAPLSAILPTQGFAKTTRSRWERVPWFIRTTLEGTSIVAIILLGISVGPKLRAFYERRIERSLGEFNEGSLAPGAESEAVKAVPLGRGKVAGSTSEGDEYSGENEAESEDEDVADDTIGDENLRVGHSEIWRFNLKTDSPHEIRPKIVQAMLDLKIPQNTAGLGGTEAPGGIQFDLLVPRTVILDLKKNLQKLAPRNAEDTLADNGLGDAFTWYKNKSRKKIPEGKTRVVIWLSQM